jgi:hypothetical protein
MILRYYSKENKSLVCPLPRTITEIRRRYTEGVESISKQLPIPNVLKLSNHSYVSIRDCFADFLF